MNRIEAVEQYSHAVKLGQKYLHDAVNRSTYPYPLVLDEILDERTLAGSHCGHGLPSRPLQSS